MSSYEDLPKGGGECNGVSHEGGEGVVGNGKGDSECSYVFVSGSDVVSDDYAEKDLNVESLRELDQPKDEKEVQVGELSIQNEENQLHEADCCVVEGTVVSSSNDGVQVESTGGLVPEGDLLQEPNAEVDVESEPQQLNGVVKKEEQTSLESGTEQTSLESGAEQTSLESGAEQTSLESGAEQTSLESGAEQTSLESGAEQTSLESGAEQTSLESGAEKTILESGAEKTILESGSEKTILESGSEKTDPESTKIALDPVAIGCELMHLDNGNPTVDGHINFKPSEEIAGSQEFLVPILETTEFKLPLTELREERVEGQNNLESIPEVTDNQGFEVVISNSDECDLHQLNNVQEKVQDESETVPETVSNENQESEIKVSEDLPFDKDQEKQTSELENDLPYEHPPVDLGVNMELNLKMPTAETNMQKEAEVAVGSVPDENGDGSPMECSPSETEVANDSVDGNQTTPELYVSSENDKSLSSYSDCVRSESTVGYVPVENAVTLPTGLDNGPVVEQEENGASLITEDFPTCAADGARQDTKVENFDPINGANVVSCPDDGTKSESEAENGPNEDDTRLACSGNDVRPETIISFGSIKFPCGDGNVEHHASKAAPKCSSCEPGDVDDLVLMASKLKDSVENRSNLPTNAVAEMKSESEVEKMSAGSNKDVVSESKVLNDSVVNSESVINSVAHAVDVKIEGDQISTKDIDVGNEGDQITSVDSDDKLTCQEARSVLGNGTSSSLEFLSTDALDSQNVPVEVGKRPFYFLIRVPRYDDEKVREEIKLAQLQVDEKTKSRDAIRSEIQTKRAVCKEYSEKFEAALSEERSARDLLKSKFQEMDSVQSVINRVKNAMSVKDIDGRIRHMEHAIEHETLPLKEEKQLIRDIKQLRNVREQLSSNLGRQEEVQQALDQKSQVEEQSKILREEVDSLKYKVQKAEVITKAAKKKYYDENEKLNELQARFKAADDIRQEAYTHLQSLRKKLSEKNKYFRMYKDNLKAANDYASAGDKEALQRLCVNEVETIMELWNNNDEFRKEYIRCNTRSTLRRLRTLDGRSLGPDEEPPVIPNFLNERIGRPLFAPTKDSSVLIVSTVEQEKQMVPAAAESADDKSVVNVTNQKNRTAKNKNPTKSATGAVSATISGRDEIEETKEEHKQTKEEEELARKAEELRKEEEAAKLKEQRRLEEKAKAKEALERKKRNAEKAQARAELRAQKEAEQKQREREKKARKKERRKSSSAEGTEGCNEAESAPSSETPFETTLDSEIIEKPRAITKKPHKSSQFTKQPKSKSIPPPLRSRGKRRIQSWMWVVLIALLVLALFLLGNSGFSYGLGLRNFGF
ncbi:microtubule-associated protein futsch isoform X2 [Vitis riparia]|nr:microtubule-associated protein futsch isoform X2 [Vitis riparia]